MTFGFKIYTLLYYAVRYVMIGVLGLSSILTGSPNQAQVKVVAHSGYCTKFLENTESSFIGAVEHGENGIETDIRFTSDGVAVTWHDGDITFTDGTTMVVKDHTYRELTAKPIANPVNGETVYLCTLERYFEICQKYKMVCFLDLKADFTDENVREMMEMGRRIYDLDYIIPQSSNVENLKKIRQQYPEQKLMLTYGRNQFERKLDYTVCFEYNFGIDCDVTVISQHMIRQFRDRGLDVAVFTCNTKLEQNYAYALDVDYMETDV